MSSKIQIYGYIYDLPTSKMCSYKSFNIFLNDAQLKQAFHAFNFFLLNPTYFTVSKNINPASKHNNSF